MHVRRSSVCQLGAQSEDVGEQNLSKSSPG